MENNNNIKKLINSNYFEFPTGLFKTKMITKRYAFFNQKIELVSPAAFVCNKTTPCDKYLISSIMVGNFVFLKDEIIQLLHKNKLSASIQKELSKQFELLKKYNYSIVIFPEKNLPIFGKCEKLPVAITEFLVESNFDLKFLYLIGTYFASPIWSNIHRRTETRYFQQFSIEHSRLLDMRVAERNKKINDLMPSSASIYASKFPIVMRSNQLAEGIDTILYCCPNCKTFFSAYAEFNCLKCHECGTLIEFSKDGKILFSNTITSFDDIEDFLFNELSHKEFDNNTLIKYEDIVMLKTNEKGKQTKISPTEVKIFADNVKIKNNIISKSIKYADLEDIVLLPNNTILLQQKKDAIVLQGNGKHNFYIILDLFKLNNN